MPFKHGDYAVPGVQPHRSSDGWDHFTGDMLAATPAVAAALAQAPRSFRNIGYPAASAIPSAEICTCLFLRTDDGWQWELELDDAVKGVVEPSGDSVERALAGQPDIVAVEHEDREVFRIALARVLTADEVLACFVDAIVSAHREFAQQRGVDLAD